MTMQISRPDLVLLDVFPKNGEVTHGAMVNGVLQHKVGDGVAIQHREVDLADSMDGLQHNAPGALDHYIEDRFVVPTEGTAKQLQQIDASGRRSVIGQSQGASDSRMVDSLWGAAQDPKMAANLDSQLGLPTNASRHDLLQALVNRVETVHEGSSAIKNAHQDMLKAASALPDGSVRVISAGNQGELSRLLTSEHIPVSSSFYESEMVDPKAIIVGAADTNGAAPRAADLASPDADAMVAANGVDVPTYLAGAPSGTGSSFAQPQVTGAVFQMLNNHPELHRDEVLQKLQGAALPLDSVRQVGSGLLQFDKLN